MEWMAYTEVYFSQVQSLGSPRSRYQSICFLLRARFLVFRSMPSLYPHMVERETSLPCLFLYQHQSHSWGCHHNDIIISQRFTFHYVTVRIRVSAHAFGGGHKCLVDSIEGCDFGRHQLYSCLKSSFLPSVVPGPFLVLT